MNPTYKHSYKLPPGTAPLYVCNAGHQSCTPGYRWGPGRRDHYLLHYVSSGRGRLCIKNHEYVIEEGQAFLVFPFETASYTADAARPWVYSWVGFNGSDAPIMLSQTDFSPQAPILFLGRDAAIAQLLLDIYDCRGNQRQDIVRMTGRLYLLLAHLIELAAQGGRVHPEKQYAIQGAAYAQNHYRQNISVADIAAQVGVSRSWLYKDFQKRFGQSPFAYLQKIRIDRGKTLLRETQLSIKEISLSVGYDDPLYFSRAFKKATGLSPTRFRQTETGAE